MNRGFDFDKRLFDNDVQFISLVNFLYITISKTKCYNTTFLKNTNNLSCYSCFNFDLSLPNYLSAINSSKNLDKFSTNAISPTG